ncbi:major capsid protein [Bacillus badius]|uniref:major capsid protein n=1 Tax=Bacillus badius TaxID=1455 RepID=UPI001CC19C6C|nr:major capsid protein [Bacillus badius]UAT29512.1 major capsid protein [Bacillus badius]
MKLYNTITLLKAAEQIPPVRTFLKDTFFPKFSTFVTEEVLLDVRKGKQKMAPFVAPRVGGVTIERDGFTTTKYKAPRIVPQRPINLEDISSRGYGENIVSLKTPQQRQGELIARDLQDYEDMITRREEWMASQILFYGSAILKGYTDSSNKNFVEQELNYNFTNMETLLGSDIWGAGGDIYSQLDQWRLDLIKKTGVGPAIAVFGRDALAKFRADSKMREMMNIRNMNFGEIKPIVQANGITFIGRLPELGLDIYTYDAWYQDDDGSMKPYVPADRILLGTPGLGGFAYGAISQIEDGKQFKTYEGKRVPKMWADTDNEVVMTRMSSRPVPVPDDVDSWYVAKVV